MEIGCACVRGSAGDRASCMVRWPTRRKQRGKGSEVRHRPSTGLWPSSFDCRFTPRPAHRVHGWWSLARAGTERQSPRADAWIHWRRQPVLFERREKVGFFAAGELRWFPLDGGAHVTLCGARRVVFGADWADDGYVYFDQGQDGIWRVPENSGVPSVVIELQDGESARFPQLLPDGEWLLFTLTTREGSIEESSIVAESLLTGERKLLVRDASESHYARRTGHLLYEREHNLFAVPVNLQGRMPVVDGSPAVVLEGIRRRGGYSLSADGVLTYISSISRLRRLGWVARQTGRWAPLPFERVWISL